MSVQTRSVLKTYFETGDKPTAAQFGDLIDSMFGANHVNVTSTTVIAAANTCYKIENANSVIFDCDQLALGESFIVVRGTNSTYANGSTDFTRASTITMYMSGYEDVHAGQDDSIICYAALYCHSGVILVNRCLYSV